jgi:hypothetical protein
MVNNENAFNAKKTEFNKLANAYVDELLATVRKVKSKKNHANLYSCLYELYKNSSLRGEIESCHSLTQKIICGNFNSTQKATAADRLRDKFLWIAEQALLKVKRNRRLMIIDFAIIIKSITLQQDLFDKYIELSDNFIKAYYQAQQSAIEENGRQSITYETLSRPSGKTKPTF